MERGATSTQARERGTVRSTPARKKCGGEAHKDKHNTEGSHMERGRGAKRST